MMIIIKEPRWIVTDDEWDLIKINKNIHIRHCWRRNLEVWYLMNGCGLKHTDKKVYPVLILTFIFRNGQFIIIFCGTSYKNFQFHILTVEKNENHLYATQAIADQHDEHFDWNLWDFRFFLCLNEITLRKNTHTKNARITLDGLMFYFFGSK